MTLFGYYHVSQRNVSTGRLTPAMLHEVLADAAQAAGLRRPTDVRRPPDTTRPAQRHVPARRRTTPGGNGQEHR